MPQYVVRYGAMRLIGVFNPPKGDSPPIRRGDQVIVRTDRGLEVGEVLCEATERVVARLDNPGEGTILRLMTNDDRREAERLRKQSIDEMDVCWKWIRKLGLQMDLVDVEHLFGGERIIVYYLADGRVDFRELVRKLAAEFQTRIEMRQIGVRDEAKLLADYGDCGKPVCCNTHLVKMAPVSMRMAKIQKATLDPAKISGRCGRLKCCLRYEYQQYEEMQRQLPKIGARVETADGPARVVGQEILAQQVLIETENRVRKLVPVDAVKVVDKTSGGADDESKEEE
ncbi:regulatory iron-sulfur-containing complex subunit RicT [Thermostilla marina]